MFTRRAALGIVGPGALWASLARATIVERGTSSRLAPLGAEAYAPPTTLKAVVDLWRRMTVPVEVNGTGPWQFVVDTGANQSVISAELMRKLGLPPGKLAPLNGIAGVDIAPTTQASLKLGNIDQDERTFSVLPAAGIGGDGMLGLDHLDGKRLTLDFRRQRVQIEQSGRTEFSFGNEYVLTPHRRDGQLVLVDVKVGGAPVKAFIDSGAEATIGNLCLKAQAFSGAGGPAWRREGILSATGQTVEAEVAQLSALRIAGLELFDWSVAFADLHTFQLWDLVHEPAILLGVDLLSRFEQVSLDFGRDEIHFRLPADSFNG
ncbi:MAG TPA: aspartyl protease family protein [Caulobacteraceae bacterium]|nr:aspartyl protease family protein [Caulobacteraceae bacterium]